MLTAYELYVRQLRALWAQSPSRYPRQLYAHGLSRSTGLQYRARWSPRSFVVMALTEPVPGAPESPVPETGEPELFPEDIEWVVDVPTCVYGSSFDYTQVSRPVRTAVSWTRYTAAELARHPERTPVLWPELKGKLQHLAELAAEAEPRTRDWLGEQIRAIAKILLAAASAPEVRAWAETALLEAES